MGQGRQKLEEYKNMKKILEKRERSLGTKLSIKGHRCNSPKCALIRKPYRPGMHGKSRSKKSEFGKQVNEKQKIRFTYGLKDRQLEAIFRVAERAHEPTPVIVMSELERRLDNVVFRLGFADARSSARSLVSHGHIMLNGRKVTIPSISLKPGDKVSIRPESREIANFKELGDKLKNYEVPGWLALDKSKLEGTMKSLPKDVDVPFDIGQVVDYYSR